MSGAQFSKLELISLVLRLTVVSAVTYLSVKWIINQVDPTNKSKKKARKKAEEQLKRYYYFQHLKAFNSRYIFVKN